MFVFEQLMLKVVVICLMISSSLLTAANNLEEENKSDMCFDYGKVVMHISW